MAECTSLGVRAVNEPAYFELERPPLVDDGVHVRTLFSGLSVGTELTYVKGTDPGFTSRRDPELGVFVEGEASRTYPVMSMGYMEVAEVVESRRGDLLAGDLVAGAYGHRSCHMLGPGDVVVPMPAGLDPVLGIYLAQMGPICANGLLHAAAEWTGDHVASLGDGVRGRHVVVTGAGVVGLLCALFAQLHDAHEVIIADPSAARLATAAALGLTTLNTSDIEPWEWTKEHWIHGRGDRGADLVLQCRGQAAVLHQALRCLRPQGTVIDLAFYQGGAPQLRLGEEFHHNGLTIRCAQIGRVPRGLEGSWDRQRLSAETGRLLFEHGDDIRRHLITDVVPFGRAAGVLSDLAARRRNAAQVVLDYR
jgi:threonine dehydrogenase-like Zn-dependent dehydrogenase